MLTTIDAEAWTGIPEAHLDGGWSYCGSRCCFLGRQSGAGSLQGSALGSLRAV